MATVLTRIALVSATAAAIGTSHLHWSRRHRALACDFHPSNPIDFPTTIDHERHGRYELVATGTRKVTFLSIRVYNVGLYVAAQDIPRIVKRLSSLEHEDREALRKELHDPDRGALILEEIAREVGVLIRIVPVRDTVCQTQSLPTWHNAKHEANTEQDVAHSTPRALLTTSIAS